MTSPVLWKLDELKEGQILPEKKQVISEAVYRGFLDCFQDHSPIHVDAGFAQVHGFRDKVMHGKILDGFISHYVGMIFPGDQGFLLSTDIRYNQPCYLEDEIRMECRISQVSLSTQMVVLMFVIHNQTQGQIAARAKVQVKMLTEAS